MNEIEKLANENRAANFIIHNLIESDNSERACYEQVMGLIRNHMQFTGAIQIYSAFRLGKKVNNNVRPMLVKCANSTMVAEILRAAPRCLKGNQLHGKTIILTDDVCKRTQEKRKLLEPKLKELKRRGQTAHIAGTVNPVIRVKNAHGRWAVYTS